jgi:hypothetical protein
LDEARATARRAAFERRQTRAREAFERREAGRRSALDCDAPRQTLVAAAEFWRSLGAAVADSFDAFNNELDREQVDRTGLTRSTFEAFAEGNARFFDSLADASRETSEQLRGTWEERPVRSEPIDYERLAKLVAEELRKTDTAT